MLFNVLKATLLHTLEGHFNNNNNEDNNNNNNNNAVQCVKGDFAAHP